MLALVNPEETRDISLMRTQFQINSASSNPLNVGVNHTESTSFGGDRSDVFPSVFFIRLQQLRPDRQHLEESPRYSEPSFDFEK